MMRMFLAALSLWLAGCGLTHQEISRREEYLDRAQTYYGHRKYMNAWHQIERALEIDPSCKRALIAKGWVLVYLEKYDEAEESFQAAHALDDMDPWLHYGFGTLAFKRGSKAEAKMAELQKQLDQLKAPANAAEILEKNRKVLEKWSLEKEKLYENALLHFQKSQQVNPENRELHRMIALVYAAQGMEKYPLSISHFDTYVGLLDDELALWQHEADTLQAKRETGMLPDSEREKMDIDAEKFRAGMAGNREQYRTAQSLVSELYYTLARREKSLNEKAVDARARREHGEKMSDYTRKARERIDFVLKSDPQLVNQYLNYAAIAKLEGNNRLAVECLREYLRRCPLADPKVRVDVRDEIERLDPEEN